MASLDDALNAERAFSANAAHELRTPIAATLAHLQLLLAETPDGPVRNRATLVEGELKRVTRLVDKLLQLARAENVSATSHASDAVPILRMVAGDLHVPLTAPKTLLMVQMDADALAMLVRNLTENAVVHGRDAHICLSEDGCLRVSNAGPVVAPEVLPILIRRFERAGSRRQGSGLGLAIVYAICRRYGLNLELASPPQGRENGFEARVKLPIASTQNQS